MKARARLPTRDFAYGCRYKTVVPNIAAEFGKAWRGLFNRNLSQRAVLHHLYAGQSLHPGEAKRYEQEGYQVFRRMDSYVTRIAYG